MSDRPTALITGASGGIGADLADLFAADGYDLVLVARNVSKLEEVAARARSRGVNAQVLAADLAKPDAPREIAAQVARVDALVNNAGFGVVGPFAETDGAQELEMLQVNIVALTHLTKLFLPQMIARKRGYVMNVASTAAFQPGPLMAVYYATKAYVLSFSEALAEEVSGSGVSVTALCPGPTATGFADAAAMTKTNLFTKIQPADSRGVARAGFEGMKRGRRIVIPGLRNRIMAQSVRVSPRALVTKIVRRLQEEA
jgi:short-subunit dehydrogenase